MKERFYYIRDKKEVPVITVCIITDGAHRSRGIALCSKLDMPCKKVGRKIARERARSAILGGKSLCRIGKSEKDTFSHFVDALCSWNLDSIYISGLAHDSNDYDFYKGLFNPSFSEFKEKIISGDKNENRTHQIKKRQF